MPTRTPGAPLRPLASALLVLLHGAIVAPRDAAAQAVQAVSNIGGENRRAFQQDADRISASLAEWSAAARSLELSAAEADDRLLAARFRARIDEVLAVRLDPLRFRLRYAALATALRGDSGDEAFLSVLGAHASRARMQQLLAVDSLDDTIRAAAIPQVAIVVPDVAFVLGNELHATEAKAVYEIGLTTNLLGAAAGTAFDAIGSTALRDYFSENLSVGTGLPAGGPGRLTAQLGVGLGGITLKRLTLWPVLGLAQADSGDARVPRSLVSRLPGERSWSSPTLSVAILPMTAAAFADKVCRGKLVPIISVGVRFPYYYPGDAFSALAALFSSKRNEFERAGAARLSAGIALPLLRVPEASKAARCGS